MLAMTGIQTYRVYRHVDVHHIQECLYPGRDDIWGRRSIAVEFQNLECRICLERITDCVPRFVAHPKVMVKIQYNEAFVFSEGACNYKDFSFTDITVTGNAWCQALQKRLVGP
jgi:hypothetical protein